MEVEFVEYVEPQEDWSIAEVAAKSFPPGWLSLANDCKEEFEHIDKIFKRKNITTFYPRKKDLFTAFDLTPLNKVKVVIFGKDPYHSSFEKDGVDVPTAMGLSFSVRRGAPIPPSLKNIFKELERSIPDFEAPKHGSLTKWAKQGVLMLNKCLTVTPGQAGSHGSIWDGFITHVLKYIFEHRPDTLFVLWGNDAQELKGQLGNHDYIESGHPSPLARSAKNPFSGNDHFVKINEYLKKKGMKPIDWTL